MLLRRCPSRSLTVVGDRAQARRGFRESWRERLERVGVLAVAEATLTINYRTPEEVMAAAEPVIQAAIPDANVPISVRASGVPVRHGALAELDRVLGDWLVAHEEGIACVIGLGVPGLGVPGAGVPGAGAAGVPGFGVPMVRVPESEASGVGVPSIASPRVRRHTPAGAKGLEFDLVVLLDPGSFGDGVSGAVDRYVAMTRATQQLVILE